MDDMRRQAQHDVSLALIALAARAPRELSPYLRRHLSGYIADGDAWRSLAAVPRVLDQLDPNAVTADALRSVFMSEHLPPEISGIIAGHHRLQSARPIDAAGMRQLATSFTQGFLLSSEQPSKVAPWMIGWSVTPSEQLHVTLPAHLGFVNEICAVLDGDYTLLASGGDDFLVRIWDPFTAAPRGEPLRAHTGTVEAVCAVPLPSGHTGVASAGSDGMICIWDITVGRLFLPPLPGHNGTIRALCAVGRPDHGSWLVSAGYDSTVRIWDITAGGRLSAVLRGHCGPVVALAASVANHANPVFYSASVDGTVRQWAIDHDQPDIRTRGNVVIRRDSGLRSLCTVRSSEHELLAFAGYDGQIDVVKMDEAGAEVTRLRGHQGAVWGLSAWGEGEQARILSAGDDATVREWLQQPTHPVPAPLLGHVGTVVSSCVIATSSGSRVIASGGSDGTLRLWSPVRYEQGSGWLRKAGPLRDVCLVQSTTSTETLVTVALGGEVCLWDFRAGRLRRPPLMVSEAPIWCVCPVLWNEHYVAVGTNDGQVLLLNEVGETTATLAAHSGPVRSLTVVVTGTRSKVLASVGDDRALRLWDLDRLALYGEAAQGHPGAGTISGVVAVATGQEAELLATCADDGSIQMWDPVTLVAVHPPMVGHVGPVLCLSVIKAGKRSPGNIVSAGVDATVRVWQTGQPTAILEITTEHAGGIRDVVVVSESDQHVEVATAGADGRVILYTLGCTDNGSWSATQSSVIHDGAVGGMRALARFTVDCGDALAVVGEAGAALLWTVSDRRLLGAPLIAASAVQQDIVALEVHGVPYCVSVGGDGGLRLWCMQSGTPVAELAGPHWGAFSSLDAIRNGRHTPLKVVSGSSDGSIRLWSPEGLELQREISLGVDKPVLDICWIEDDVVSAVIDDGTLEIWDISVGSRVRTIPGLGVRTHCRAMRYRDQNLLLFVDHNGRVGLLQPSTGEVLEECSYRDDERVYSIASTPVGDGRARSLASAGAGGSVHVWEPLNSASRQSLSGASGELHSLVHLQIAGLPLLAAGGSMGEIALWDAIEGSLLNVIPLGAPILSLTDASTAGSATLLTGTTRGIMSVNLAASIAQANPDQVGL